MCTLTRWCHSKIISRLLDTNDVPSLSSIPTWDIALKKNQQQKNLYTCVAVFIVVLKDAKWHKRLHKVLNKVTVGQ